MLVPGYKELGAIMQVFDGQHIRAQDDAGELNDLHFDRLIAGNDVDKKHKV
jgi:hypothetical protein